MLDGIKVIEIQAQTGYPVVSAYEFEFLKGEKVVKDRLKDCSLYLILQRPLTYFQNLILGEGVIDFEIADGINPPLECRLDLEEAKMIKPGGIVDVEIQYYKDQPDLVPPHNDVAAFKILTEAGEFAVWETPQKLLYEAIVNGLPLYLRGDISPYLAYHVHYIGKAWSQNVWNRLTGHHKVQKILTMEDSISPRSRKLSFEISVLLLDIVGFDEGNMIGGYEALIPEKVQPIIHEMKTEEEIDAFFSKPPIAPRAPELTSEAEALLIKLFKPEYNGIMFENYPNIANGTRSVGYTLANLTVTRMPMLLTTAHRPNAAMGDVKFEMEA
ncbi:hypothetical protein FHS26_004360 [Rhizobium pisi]|uniref:Uncharacterized protein n=1 Tax=Rhizobium pisi TaxID=574561 RepID=A0A7W5BRA9_9HYPH|nr:hypothetical protein [Rhizobium pisi]MBB3136603.1 hypothetical protein [Rhizobium pisi]